MISITQKGDFKSLDKYMTEVVKLSRTSYAKAESIAIKCIERLREVTPKDSGLTSESWEYEIISSKKSTSIQFNNTNIQNGLNVALLLELGHGTRNGTWIEGKEFIEPTIRQAYLDAINNSWEDITRL